MSRLVFLVLVSFHFSDTATLQKDDPDEMQEYPLFTTETPVTGFDFAELTTDATLPPGRIGTKTIITIKFPFDKQEQVFLRGGYTDGNPSKCLDKANLDPCSIPIRHFVPQGAPQNYSDWAKGDVFLDWNGREETQGDHNGTLALGTPMRKMESAPALHRSNTELTPERLAATYWVVELDMDCSNTYGYFEVKVVVKPNKGKRYWVEKGIVGKSLKETGEDCGGIGSQIPFYSDSHIGRCGFVNIFGYRNSYCEINNIID